MRAAPAHRCRRGAAAVLLAGCGLLSGLLCGGLWSSAQPARAASGASGSAGSTVKLLSESPAVVQESSGLSLKIEVSSPLPPSKLGLSVTLFSKTAYLSTFEQALSGDTTSLSVISGTPGPIPLATVEPARTPVGSPAAPLSLRLPVSAPDLPGEGGPPPKNGTILQVSCVAGGCAGVYPLQISLVDLSEGLALDTFTTFMVLAPPSEVASSVPLRFAWTIPIGQKTSLTPAGKPALSPRDLSELQLLSATVASDPSLNLTFDLSPQFVKALSLSHSAAASQGLAALRSFARSPQTTELVPDTFAPLDLPALFSSGLGRELPRQIAAGRSTLGRLLGTGVQHDVFAPSTGIGQRVLASLVRSGITALVLPASSVAEPSVSELSVVSLSPFVVPHSGAEAIESDSGLESHLSRGGGPVLRATQLLANLAVLYFQVPYAKKGASLVAPGGWRPSAPFLAAVAAGLSRNPLVEPTTDSGLFENVPPGAVDPSGGLRSRKLAPAEVRPSDLLPGSAITGATNDLRATTSLAPGDSATNERLGEALLMSEARGLDASSRRTYLAAIRAELERRASLVGLPYGHVITITSLTAKVPISIVSRARLPLHVVLEASSPDLSFPGATRFALKLVPHTNLVPIRLSARSAGNFSLDLSVASPTGLVLRSGRILIRSTAISGVAVGLSIAALAVLVLWWVRSIIRRRRGAGGPRRGALAARALLRHAAAGTPGSQPAPGSVRSGEP